MPRHHVTSSGALLHSMPGGVMASGASPPHVTSHVTTTTSSAQQQRSMKSSFSAPELGGVQAASVKPAARASLSGASRPTIAEVSVAELLEKRKAAAAAAVTTASVAVEANPGVARQLMQQQQQQQQVSAELSGGDRA